MRVLKKIYKIYEHFVRSVKRLNIDAYAACTSFFLLLSFMPMMILLCSILPFTRITEQDVTLFFEGFTPEMFWDLEARLIDGVYSGGYAVLTISAIITLWTASRGVASLVQGLNAVNDVEEKRNFFVRRGVCCLYTLILLGALYISLVLMVFGKTIANQITRAWPDFSSLHGILVKPRHLYIFLILTLFFAVLYSFLPNKKQKFREQLPGAVFSSFTWIIFSWLFSLFISKYNPYSMYGNMAMVVVVMVWIYFCLLFFMYGAYLNRYFKPVNIVLVYPKKRRDKIYRDMFGDGRDESMIPFGTSVRKPIGHENDESHDADLREEIDTEQDYLE